ncbi:NAD(P)H-binding protein [Formosa haliotis]|uniref:NAD(P)H-binding protein n=1 Tax=Formosa haliotis TaxID=1555194 RepID=UPI001F3F4BD2|nr:NAD(P)H-binding protein [Formosa haliotis]
MIKNISVLGCGWLGLPLAEILVDQGYLVKGSTTQTDKLKVLEAEGIAPFLIDINHGAIASTFLDSEVVIILITSKDLDSFTRLIQEIEASAIKHVIFVSSTSVYPNTNGIVTETSETKSSPLLDIENAFRSNTHFSTTIIRFGGLFGYQRKPGNFIRARNIIPNPEGFVNLIHQDDCVSILTAIIRQNVWGEIFNACADSHPKRADFYTKEMAKVERFHPVLDPSTKNEYKIVSPKKLIDRLNFQFKYSDLMAY